MRKIILSLIVVISLILVLIGCSNIILPTKILSADIIVTEWEQEYYEYSGELRSHVYIYYKIENTGNVDICYYKIWFTVTCIDEMTYGILKIGQSIDTGQSESDYVLFYIPNKHVISIEIIKLELGS